MKKTIRIYRRHDLDLFSLGIVKKYHLGREMKKALIAYANRKAYYPPATPKLPEGETLKTSMMLHINLDEKKPEEKKAIELLNKTKYGYCNAFIKAIFRNYLDEIPLKAYSTDSNIYLQGTNESDTVRNIQRTVTKATVDKFNAKDDSTKTTKKDEKVNDNEPLEDEPQDTESSEDVASLFAQMDAFTH